MSASLGCAARGHIATPQEMTKLRETSGLSASGRLTIAGPQGKFSARLIFGAARPNSLRIEVPAGAGLRFLLIAKDGKLRADLPQEDAMYEGPATASVMKELFGMDLAPGDLVDALLGSPPSSLAAEWRFDRALPRQMTLRGTNRTRLTVTFDEPEIEAPVEAAFRFGPARPWALSLPEMSERLGLSR